MNRRDFLYRSAVGTVAGASYSRADIAFARTLSPLSKVRVGVIGAKHAHAAGKLAAIRDLHDVFELVGVVEPDAEFRKSLEKHPKYRDVRWFTEKVLLASPNLDAVVIETAVHDLVPTAQRCIDADKHVHLEKPGCESRKAFTNLFESAERRQRHIQMGYMLRHNPAFEFCCRAVREGMLGRVFEVTGAMSKLVEAKGRKEFVDYKGGTMFELGCHLIDAVVAVLGTPTNVNPFSRVTRPDQVLDNQLAVFEYPEATATIRSSIVEPFGNERRHFEVSGENGTIAIRPLEPPHVELVLERPAGGFTAGRQAIELPASTGRYDGQLREFAAIVRGDVIPRWSADHDLAVHLAVLQASGLPTDR